MVSGRKIKDKIVVLRFLPFLFVQIFRINVGHEQSLKLQCFYEQISAVYLYHTEKINNNKPVNFLWTTPAVRQLEMGKFCIDSLKWCLQCLVCFGILAMLRFKLKTLSILGTCPKLKSQPCQQYFHHTADGFQSQQPPEHVSAWVYL